MALISSGERIPNWISFTWRRGAAERGNICSRDIFADGEPNYLQMMMSWIVLQKNLMPSIYRILICEPAPSAP
jgi:hypothetical protein